MRKFKLIKELPFDNSLKIGYISEPHSQSTHASHYWNHNWFKPERYPEYWEEVTEEEDILMNTRCLSLNDVATIYKGINQKTKQPSSQANKLKELVKSRL